MTAPGLDLRRQPTRPAGNLFRVTAAVTFVSLPLLWVAYWVYPLPKLDSCPPDAQEACPATVTVGGSVEAVGRLLPVAVVQLVLIGCYVALTAVRRTLDLRTSLRWAPTTVAVVALAIGGFSWLADEVDLDLDDFGTVGLGYLLLLALWLLTPLVLYVVHRGDRRAVLPVFIGLAPTAASGLFELEDSPLAALPSVMLVIAVIIVTIVRRRWEALP